jgi:hypothetical protein
MTEKSNYPEVEFSKHGVIQSTNAGVDWESLLARSEGALSPALNCATLVQAFIGSSTIKVDAAATVAVLAERIADIWMEVAP